MKKLREMAEKIAFNEGSSQSVQDAFLRHLLRVHGQPLQMSPHELETQGSIAGVKPRKRRHRRAADLADMDSPQQLSFDFGDTPSKKS